MTTGLKKQQHWRRGGATAAIAAAWLLLSYAVNNVGGEVGPTPVFCLVTVVCSATVVLTRGLGWVMGLSLGLLVGLVTSAGLANQLMATGSSLAFFISISSMILCLLGGVAGAATTRRYAEPRPSRMLAGAPGAEVGLSPKRSRGGPGRAFAYVLANMADDFCAWMDSPVGRQSGVESQDCSGFDQFVRTSLRQRLHAASVRVYGLTPDGAWFEPLARSPNGTSPRLAASEGSIAKAISSGQAIIVNEGLHSPASAAPPESAPERNNTPHHQHEPRWLLPLRSGARTEILVTVARVAVPRSDEQRVAAAVRVQLQLFWRQLSAQRMLSRHLRVDRQTGMLERLELITHLDEVVGAVNSKPEPVMVLALAVEGMRKLDDLGLWAQRDLMIQDLGRALRSKIRADDVLGRFSDDRFVVVLHGLESALATRVAEQLVQTVRTEAILSVCQPPGSHSPSDTINLNLRAGLAGTGPQRAASTRPFATFDVQIAATATPPQNIETGQGVLLRALGLIDYARRQRIELATDLMAGLPDELARNPKTSTASTAPTGAAPASASSGGAEVPVHENGAKS